MPLRSLNQMERANLAKLTSLSIDVTLIQPTRTGLGKAILDATAAVRNYLKSQNLHDYETQGTGARENGVKLPAALVSSRAETASKASLYRPNAKGKGGDPRIWFSGLPAFANPDDIIAIAAHDGTLLCINITNEDLVHLVDNRVSGPLLDYLTELSKDATSVSDELLARLVALSRDGFIPSVMDLRADTAIGRTIETALGIEINSRKEPDYNGIELKAFRRAAGKSRENRKTLFAKVANWQLSKFKSSKEILDHFGYERGEDFKLYCTVNSKTQNSQGLYFDLDEKAGLLNERSTQKEIGAFATWVLEELRTALSQKHNETFWIGANSHIVDDREHFELTSVLHTKRPILSQFDILLEQGEITMDHLIKRNAKGRVAEKGPLFKINTASLPLLFPPSKTYALKELH